MPRPTLTIDTGCISLLFQTMMSYPLSPDTRRVWSNYYHDQLLLLKTPTSPTYSPCTPIKRRATASPPNTPVKVKREKTSDTSDIDVLFDDHVVFMETTIDLTDEE